jgi:putative ABC transport system permease protein
VNEEFAKRFLPDGALGKQIVVVSNTPSGRRTIVGIVPTIQTNEVGEKARPYMYFPAAQSIVADGGDAEMLVRTRVPLDTLATTIAAAWRADDKSQPVPYVRPLAAYLDAQAAPTRASAILLGALAVLGLVLAVSGTASVVAYAAARLTNEIGIRVALGARTGAIVLAMLRGAAVMTVLGVAIGLCLAALTSRALSDQLYETKPLDPVTFVSVALMLAVATLVASTVPAYRAARVDPAVALRYE